MRARKAAIVGGGVAGLLAARLLLEKGLEVRLFEAYPELRPVGAGLTLWPNATRVLKKIGLLEAVLRSGQTMRSTEIRSQKGFILANMQLDRFDAPTIGISRHALLHILAEGFAEDRIFYNHRCSGFEQNGAEAAVHFDNGMTVEADIVVAADGLHSVFGMPEDRRELRYSGYTSWRGMAAIPPGFKNECMFEAWGRGKRFGYVPISRDRFYWFATKNAPAGLKVKDKHVIAAHFADLFKPIASLIESTEDSAFVQTDIYDKPPARPYTIGRFVRIGDAAHPMTPNLGQGACMAMEDAFCLANLLNRGEDSLKALSEYEQKRWKRTSMIVRQSWTWGRFTQTEGAVSCRIRDAVARMTPSAIQNRTWTRLFEDAFEEKASRV